MFTGVIEEISEVVCVVHEGAGLHLSVKCAFTKELKIDQSVAHNGVCLTVVAIGDDVYQATAIAETLAETHLGSLQTGDIINLERGMLLNTRLDRHIVQGHVDQTATHIAVEEENGGKHFSFAYDPSTGNVVIEKGSVTVNGVSLIVVDVIRDGFSVAVIPYALARTNLCYLAAGSVVNLEFDVIGRCVTRLIQQW